jgi:hypothetical protein
LISRLARSQTTQDVSAAATSSINTTRAVTAQGVRLGLRKPRPPESEERASEMTQRKSFTVEEARQIGEHVGIDWDAASFGSSSFAVGSRWSSSTACTIPRRT